MDKDNRITMLKHYKKQAEQERDFYFKKYKAEQRVTTFLLGAMGVLSVLLIIAIFMGAY
ncbi:hypothetical protein QGM71_01165 [Virgibacillus sp. C22-A2]|uniref:Uncharacterized protein n=1 Tax=Virgibacillus tibetensis TaxID=3042313 RepID=A0ABU6KC49_9BACI|nr:hypothetical protein [Virgibacillus sp. C22-A2]